MPSVVEPFSIGSRLTAKGGRGTVTVPLEHHSGLIKESYEALGGTMTLEVVEGGGHDMSPHWFRSQALVDVVLNHAGKVDVD